jgi:outer membrane protein, heavy metal efflux system
MSRVSGVLALLVLPMLGDLQGALASGPDTAFVPSTIRVTDASEASSFTGFAELALQTNPLILAERVRLRALGFEPRQAGALPATKLEVELMTTPTDPAATNPLTVGPSVGLSQELPFPGQLRARTGASRAEVSAAEARLVAMERSVRRDILVTLVDRTRARDLAILLDGTAKTLAGAREAAEVAYTSGLGSQADLLQAQAAETGVLVEKEPLEAEMDRLDARLRALSGTSSDAALLSTLVLPEPHDLPPLDGLLALVDQAAPEVVVALAEQEAAARQQDVARFAGKPDFDVGIRYRFNDPTMAGMDTLSLGLGASLPVLAWRGRVTDVRHESDAKRDAAGQSTNAAMAGAREALEQAWRTAREKLRVNTLYRQGLLVQARATVAATNAAYSVGKADFAAVISTLGILFETERQMIATRADYLNAVWEVEMLVGQPLSSFSGQPTATDDDVPGHEGAPVEGSRP